MALALGLSSRGACPGPTCSSSAASSLLTGCHGASLRAACLAPWRCTRTAPRRRRQQPLHAALLDPPPFDPDKLRVQYLPGGREPGLAAGRRYTLTHNDVTGSLQLSIGREYNRDQLDGWYTRMLRDEILAEWRETAAPVRSSSNGSSSDGEGGGWRSAPQPSLHVYCHVSGEELWPAPPALRSFIFQREMALVLDTIMHAERDMLLAVMPTLADAPVYVHLHSDIPALDRVLEWGRLGDRASWRSAQSSMLGTLLSSVLGTIDEADSDGSDGSWSRGAFSASSSWDGGAGGGGLGLGAGAGPGAVAWAGGSWDAGDHPQQVQQQQAQQQQQLEEEQQQPGATPGSSSNGAASEHPVAGEAAACSGSGGSNGSGSLAAANSAVSLAAVQQAGEYPSWLGATAVVADGRRRPAAEVVPAAVRSRQR
ncbi:Histone-lysine N-methyltransferase ASHR1 [Chlorella sorokiniana]|uniref:Histone-lysine N-methyltransferase ASHR1 n=1 Tax=Chlorella sorokiniana TaxID=3076 RepID=A0A2P6TR57_CHLSO|nr:Histone-lysine N-methyltransferase ASHR1 [Chlorella sorokiniana]|eukprot:PRW56547.1 Histone-lysine N-methyltransferase ASHR1 [Chlorella sorokiniana]